MTELGVESWIGDHYGVKKFGLELSRQWKTLVDNALEAEEGTRAALDVTQTIAVNAPWGKGKSFFLAGLVVHLRKSHPVITFDAWETDFAGNPIAAFCFELVEQLSKMSVVDKELIEETKVAIRDMFFHYSKYIVGGVANSLLKACVPGGSEVIEGFKGGFEKASEELILSEKSYVEVQEAEYISVKNSIRETKKALEKIVERIRCNDSDFGLPLYIVIDELDRCRPIYAIELLEHVKHTFAVKGVFFVFGTNLDALSHSARAVYGSSFDGREYLNRFFSLEYQLPVTSNQEFVRGIFEQNKALLDKVLICLAHKGDMIGELSEMLGEISSLYDLTPRDLESICRKLFLILQGSEKFHAFPLFVLLCYWQRNKEAAVTASRKIDLGERFSGVFNGLSIHRYPRFDVQGQTMRFDQIFLRYVEVANSIAKIGTAHKENEDHYNSSIRDGFRLGARASEEAKDDAKRMLRYLSLIVDGAADS
ncbi:P-loop NTPase fold protein [Chitinimonas viridis]|uniref:P-loop NTPase fold protein n=1 Tax=Chitinimonas viridis TaxID=664880 RepID=A0ABT8B357_9NEIS|nr:P-loop NTPase fold protein [Chitinimonas viridis]MDN3576282.1 P-loop NTPase fold protein [Chitinimonas viridis]